MISEEGTMHPRTVGELIALLQGLASSSPSGEESPLVVRHRQPRWDYMPRVWTELHTYVPSLVNGSVVMQDVVHPASDPQFYHHPISTQD